MGLKGIVGSVEVTFLVHATEDRERIEGAVVRTLGLTADPEATKLEGHFGNEMTLVRFAVRGPEAEEALKRVVVALDKSDREVMRRDVADYVDEHHALYMRLSKQAMVRGLTVLGGDDSVRVKVKPRLFGPKKEAAQLIGAWFDG